MSEPAAAPRTTSRPQRTPTARGRLTVGVHLGETGRDAAQAVRRTGLTPGLELLALNEGAIPGTVIAQDPEAGSELARGELVRLYIAPPTAEDPPEQLPIPSLDEDVQEVPLVASAEAPRRSRKRGALPAAELSSDPGPAPTIPTNRADTPPGPAREADSYRAAQFSDVREADEARASFAAGSVDLEHADDAFARLRDPASSTSALAEIRSGIELLITRGRGWLGRHRVLWIGALVIAAVGLLIAASSQQTNRTTAPSTPAEGARTKRAPRTAPVHQARRRRGHSPTRAPRQRMWGTGHHLRVSVPRPPAVAAPAAQPGSPPASTPVEAAPEGEPEQSGGGLFSP
jgi:hypothetical protein